MNCFVTCICLFKVHLKDNMFMKNTLPIIHLLYRGIQVNLIITLSLGSKETDRVTSEPCYNEVIYNRHIAK